MKPNKTDILLRDEITMKYFNEIKRNKVLSDSEFSELFNDYKTNNNMDSFNKIIKSNLKYVVTVAKKYQNNGVSLNDLISAGDIGLIIALKKFDITLDTKLITYAKYYILREIGNQIEQFNYTQKYKNALISNSKKNNSLFDESNCINRFHTFSINTPTNTAIDSEDTYESVLSNNDTQFDADNNFKFEAIYKAIDMLSSDEKSIICYRFGINNNKPMTFEEISEVYMKNDTKKVTPECIRLKCNSIIQKLKKITKAHEANLCEEL